MKFTPKVYTTRREKTIDFVIGIVGLHIVNIVLTTVGFGLTYLLFQIPTNSATVPNVFLAVPLFLQLALLLVNIGLLVYFGVTRGWIALGALVAIGFYMVLTICAAVMFAAACFVNLANPIR